MKLESIPIVPPQSAEPKTIKISRQLEKRATIDQLFGWNRAKTSEEQKVRAALQERVENMKAGYRAWYKQLVSRFFDAFRASK